MKAYSIDLREKVIKAYERKEHSLREIAAKFEISLSSVHRYIKAYQRTGSLRPKPRTNKHLIKVDRLGELFLVGRVERKPDITLEELKREFQKKFGLTIGRSTISRKLIELDSVVTRLTIF